jgi:hypothetical protein
MCSQIDMLTSLEDSILGMHMKNKYNFSLL